VTAIQQHEPNVQKQNTAYVRS